MGEESRVPPEINASVAHPARVYDYWLGGKDNYPADREAAEQAIEAMPNIALFARTNRAFLRRAVRFLAAEAGIRQFLDIGTGLPTSPNVHQVAQQIAPASRVVYVDNDPIVLVHARALLTSSPEGATDYLEEDVRDPDKILQAAARTLDFDRPVAVMVLATCSWSGTKTTPTASWRGWWTRCPRAATWRSPIRPRTSRSRGRPRPGRGSAGSRSVGCTCGPAPRWPGSSRAWSWWSLAWSSRSGGGPIRARRVPLAR
jgi:S-adenosyl methyltransferase